MADATTLPTWYDQLSSDIGTQVSGGLSQIQNLNTNWYDQPLTAGLSTQQQNLISGAPTTAGQWQPQFQQGAGNLAGAATQAAGATTWDPTQLQQHLNPYLGGVLDEIQRRSTQSLTQNVIPQINQSFTGSGLFGSSRQTNKFLPEAIAASQREMLGAQANAGLSAYNQAAQDYLNWGQLGNQGAQTLSNIGSQQGTQALAGQQQRWTDVDKQFGLEEAKRQVEQAGLDASYKDWQTQLSTPYNLLGALGNVAKTAVSPYSSSTSSGGSSNISDILSIIAAINAGATGS